MPLSDRTKYDLIAAALDSLGTGEDDELHKLRTIVLLFLMQVQHRMERDELPHLKA